MTTKARGIWWLSPVGAVTLMVLPTLFLAARTSDARYRFAWDTPKALTDHTVVLVLCGVFVFLIASLLPMWGSDTRTASSWPDFTAEQNRILQRSAGPLFWLTMSGYGAFAASGVRNGLTVGALTQALLGQNVEGGQIRAAFVHIPGVTTLTQVGIAFVVVAMLILVQGSDRRLRRRVAGVLVLALLRASLVGERLAILELLIPAAAVIAFRQTSTGRPRRRLVAVLAPIALIPTVIALFGIFEYSRSWVFYSTKTSESYLRFVVERLAGYYATAYNNGQLGLTYERYPGRVPFESIQALWTAPGASLFYSYPVGRHGIDPVTSFDHILQLHGNPEFNSPGGLVLPFIDWGTGGGLVFLGVAGVLVGYFYKRCRDGHPFAVVLYPSMTTGLFELPRYIYWGLGRYTPSLIALAVIGFLMTRHAARPGASVDPPVARVEPAHQ